MAGNSVPAFFGAKARSFKPPGVDVTFLSDISGSMGPYLSFFVSTSTVSALELALRDQGVGITSSNRYSFAIAGNLSGTTAESSVFVNGNATRWATGSQVLDGSANLPVLRAGPDNEDMGAGSNYITSTDRGYTSDNAQIILAGSDEQSYGSAFSASPTYPHRYVGIHGVTFSVTEPAGPNPVPAGVLIGFVYTTDTTGVAIYSDAGTVNYRLDVPVANFTATAAGVGTSSNLQINIDRAADTNGAIYSINAGFGVIATSLGTVLGSLLYASA